MKHLNKLIAAAILCAGLSTQAQDADHPWGEKLKVACDLGFAGQAADG